MPNMFQEAANYSRYMQYTQDDTPNAAYDEPEAERQCEDCGNFRKCRCGAWFCDCESCPCSEVE